ncbi:MAG: LamG-like jellyroll fold domain-containing protein, partial [Candidatus Thermoplasmatota archaeon]|nr:LamG-like jellyroll fold domain-containing protein [Candidatus Thermoplasmatota archaeon]
TGIIHIPSDGNWTFYLSSDDGGKLWIDDVEIVDNQGHHGMRERSGVVWLEAGEHELRTEFFEHGGHAGLQLKWEGPGVSKQTVPTNVLTRGSSYPVRENALMHYWDFEESSGDQANDSVGNAHLNFSGTNGTQWRNCVLGNCAFFDGIDDEARVDVEDTVSDFTVSIWVQANHSGQSRHSSVIAVNDVAGDDDSFQFQTSGGNPGNWELYHNNSYSFGTVDPTAWQHLVATFENDTITLYMDGVEILNQSVPNGTVNSIEIYKFGVNRAGNTHFAGVIDEVQIWETALTPEEVSDVHNEIVWICPSFNTTNNSIAYVEQRFQIDSELAEHVWIMDGYSMRDGWVEGDWWLEVEAYDQNGNSVSLNRSQDRAFSDDWQSRQLRFRPGVNTTELAVRQVAEFSDGTYNGSIFFDTLKLYPIRPHFEWLDGSIAETAVSTGGRTFVMNSSYGQSLVSDLLDDGVSGVKGYVFEPYLTAVSNPEQLLSCYASGFTISECYAASNVQLSWMGTVIGDPKMAAYSDRLHDINVSEVMVPNRLSEGENGTIEVLLENLAPGVASGFLEVRERLNNVLLSNTSLTIPGGNEHGSRVLLPVNITPSRIGFSELLVRWIPLDSSPERIVNNNLNTIEVDINGPPSIDEVTCSTTIATRGGIVICQVEVSDDFGISSATLSWRYNNSNISFSPISATPQNNGSVWKVAISLPTDAPLDQVDLHWIVYDVQNQTAESYWDAAFQIIDASATWYGVHVSGADLEPWLGYSPPIHGMGGWIRGESHMLTACVIDVDHDNLTEIPVIFVDDIELASPILFSSSGSKTCYQTTWFPEAGGPLEPVSIVLRADGVEWSNRSLAPIDLPPQAELSISGQDHLDGGGDIVLIELNDPDDPSALYELNTTINWPGAGLQILDEGAVTAPPGLESGDAEITTQIIDGKWAGIEWSWSRPVYLTPPQISAPTLCVNDMLVDTINRGAGGAHIWVGVTDGRPIDYAGIRLGPFGPPSNSFSSILFELGTPPASCAPGTGQNTDYYRMILNPDYLLTWPLGNVELEVNLRDIDGISGLSQALIFELRGSKPELDFSRMPSNFTSGKLSTLVVEISDLDGINNMECSVLLKDQDDITIHSQMFIPAADGLWTLDWNLPGTEATNHTLYFACLDETSLSVTESMVIKAQAGGNISLDEQTTTQQEGNDSNIAILIGVVLTGFLIIMIVTVMVFSRNKEDLIEEIEQLPNEAWANQNRDGSKERLAEMAGLSNSESKEWTDEELLGAGWTQEQIDIHRSRQNNADSEAEILGIFEEE